MATSGTVGATSFTVREILEDAFEACKIPPQALTAELAVKGLRHLNVFLSSLPQRAVALWAQDDQLLTMPASKIEVACPAGTIDILSAAIKQLTRVTGTDATASDRLTTTLTTDAIITTVGVKATTAATLAILIETSTDNVTYTQRLAPASRLFAASEWVWFDLDPAITADYVRVRSATGAAFAISAIYIGTSPSEVPLTRVNIDRYEGIPNKTSTGRPVLYHLNRDHDVPVMRIWPTPDSTYVDSPISIRRQRHVEDVTLLTETVEIPQRWHDAVIYGLAYHLAKKVAQIPAGIAESLKGDATEALTFATFDERDSSPGSIVVDFSGYTR